MRKYIKLLWYFKLAVGVGVIAWLLSSTPLDRLASVFSAIDTFWILPVLILPHLAILLSSIKWQILLAARGCVARQGLLFRLYLVGTFFNNFLPSMVGGDVVRVYQLARHGCDAPAVVASTFLERFVGLAALVSLLPLAAMQPTVAEFLPRRWQLIAMAALAIVAIVVVIFFVNFTPNPSEPASGQRLYQRIASKIWQVREQLHSFRGHSNALVWSFFISVAFYFVAGLTVWCATRAVGATVDPWIIVSVTPMILALALVPISINGLGILEAGYTWLLTSLGMPISEALAVALLLRGRSLLTSGIGAVVFVLQRRTSSEVNRVGALP